MSYLVLARKYRPQTFDQIVGQGHVTRTLENAIRSDRVHHAYLMCGVRGLGKTTAARILAKCLVCEQGPTPTPCDECTHCTAIMKGSSVDVLEIDGASNNSVDDIRNLRDQVNYLPQFTRRKIYIIDEVHMLTASAFNALLKTLEEPPPHVTFIFATTDPHKVLPTILSRVSRLDFRRVRLRDMMAHLQDIATREAVKIEEAALAVVAGSAEGSVRDAMTALDKLIAFGEDPSGGGITAQEARAILGQADRASVAALADAVFERDASQALERFDEITRIGCDLTRFALSYLQHLRDLMVLVTCGRNDALLDLPDTLLAGLEAQSKRIDAQRVAQHFDRFSQVIEQLEGSRVPKMVLEMALLDLVHAQALIPLGDLVERLGQLPAGPAQGGGASGPSGSSGPGPSGHSGRGGPGRGKQGGSSRQGNNWRGDAKGPPQPQAAQQQAARPAPQTNRPRPAPEPRPTAPPEPRPTAPPEPRPTAAPESVRFEDLAPGPGPGPDSAPPRNQHQAQRQPAAPAQPTQPSVQPQAAARPQPRRPQVPAAQQKPGGMSGMADQFAALLGGPPRSTSSPPAGKADTNGFRLEAPRPADGDEDPQAHAAPPDAGCASSRSTPRDMVELEGRAPFEAWEMFLEQVRQEDELLFAVLADFGLLRLVPGELVLAAPRASFAADQLQQNAELKARLDELLSAIFGESTRMRLEDASPSLPELPSLSLVHAQRKRTQRQAVEHQARTHPGIRAVLDAFGGTLAGVDPLKAPPRGPVPGIPAVEGANTDAERASDSAR